MKTFRGIKLEFKDRQRDNYMSLSDLFQDLTTDCLINLLPKFKSLKNQMSLMNELEGRIEEIGEDRYYEILETCNGI